MPDRPRYLGAQVRRDLPHRMVFVAGPRQVGKTTFARSLPGARAGYLSWDIARDRERILMRTLPAGRLWVFDELKQISIQDVKARLSAAVAEAESGNTIVITVIARPWRN